MVVGLYSVAGIVSINMAEEAETLNDEDVSHWIPRESTLGRQSFRDGFRTAQGKKWDLRYYKMWLDGRVNRILSVFGHELALVE